jgi:hypothetical protein
MLSLLLASLAFAGEIVVETSKPVIVFVDGEAVDFPEGSMTATAAGLGDGSHLIEVRNLLGRRVTELKVDLKYEDTLRTTYKNKLLAVVDKYASEEPAPVVQEQPAVEESASMLTLEDLGDGPTMVAVGSVSIMLPTSAEVGFNGSPLEYSASNEGFVATEQGPGQHTLKVTFEGVDMLDESVEVVAGQNYQCVLVRDKLECQHSSPAIGLPEVEVSTLSAAALGAGVGEDELPPSKVRVVFSLVDDKDFSKVFVDGSKAADFSQSVANQPVELGVGVHVVEIRGFDDSVWYRGKFTVGAGQEITLKYSQADGVILDGGEGSWEEF